MGGLLSRIGKIFPSVSGRKLRKTQTSAVILAGGSSVRMGGESKQLIELMGIPVIVHTLLAFEKTEEIKEIILVAKADQAHMYEDFKLRYGITKLKKVVCGGNTRQISAVKGFNAVSKESSYVAIHDCARCLVTPDEISRVCHKAYAYGAATAASGATDTIKIANKQGFIRKTVNRQIVWNAQTPQVFDVNIYSAALAIASRDGISVTDDCSLVENIRHDIKLVPCSKNNIKITSPDDILHAEAILRNRRSKEEQAK